MNPKNLTASAFITVALLILSFSMSVILAIGEPTNVTFSVNLSLSGNAGPSVVWVQSGLSASPVESSTRTVYVLFNASDNNGYQDIDYTAASVILYIDGEPQRASSSCVAYSNDSLVMALNCTVTLQYYDLASSSWTINASVQDSALSYDEDTATTFTYNGLQAIRGNVNGITFGAVTLDANFSATNNPLTLNNTGNTNFTTVNVTAYDLVGQVNPDQYIAASSLYVNYTQNSNWIGLSNNSDTNLSLAVLPRDIGGSDTNQNLYFHVAMPAAGLSNQNYSSSSDWVVEVLP